MKISASIYSTKTKDLPSLVLELNELKIDALHIDCFDQDLKKVEKDLKAIRKFTNLVVDFHAITSNPFPYIKLAEKLKIEQLAFQWEKIEDKDQLQQTNRNYKIGVAVVSTTDLRELENIAPFIDFILLMTTEPGKSGGVFNQTNFNRIYQARKLYPHLDIHVDGGINAEVAYILRILGVDLAVSGSFLVNHNNPAIALADLRFQRTSSAFKVKEYMIPKEELPVMEFSESNFESIIKSIEAYKLGFVLLENEGLFYGVSTNADVRGGIIQKMPDFHLIKNEDIVNTSPVAVYEDLTTGEMLQIIKKVNFPVLFLPVLNNNKKLVGAVLLNQLIKG
jgi:ribulose-phosphate 3-epimerase